MRHPFVMVSDWEGLTISRFFICATFTYADRYLSWICHISVITWGIILIQGIRVESGAFSYDSWNWFVAACGVPSLLLGFWLFSFPESPKFMMECGDYDDALKCLKSVYRQNTGDDPDNYPVCNIFQPSIFLSSKIHKNLNNLIVFIDYFVQFLNF